MLLINISLGSFRNKRTDKILNYRYGHTQHIISVNVKMTAFRHIIRRKYENNIALSPRNIGTISRSKEITYFQKAIFEMDNIGLRN